MLFTRYDDFDFAVGGVSFVVKREPDSKWRLNRRNNENQYILALAISGEAEYSDERSSFKVQEGDVLFFRKGERHSAVASETNPWSFICAAFELIDLNGGEKFLDIIPTVIKTGLFSECKRIFSELHSVWNLKETGCMLKCRSLISDLLYLLICEINSKGENTASRERILRLKKMLAENYRQSFSVEELADMAGVSCSHFRMLFKQYTGETAMQFQHRIKIAKACDLLRSGTCNVTEAAYAVGFSDIYYFSRLFKKITGFNPSKYIKI